MRIPRTPEEWQEAVDCAEGALALDSARQFGLVKYGPWVNVERCERVLAVAAKRGIVPSKDAVERFAMALIADGEGLR